MVDPASFSPAKLSRYHSSRPLSRWSGRPGQQSGISAEVYSKWYTVQVMRLPTYLDQRQGIPDSQDFSDLKDEIIV